jgi:hypothetical protein
LLVQTRKSQQICFVSVSLWHFVAIAWLSKGIPCVGPLLTAARVDNASAASEAADSLFPRRRWLLVFVRDNEQSFA